MKYICPKCATSFDDKMALCESRRDKDRCFGCPTCQTFYRKELIYPKLNRKILIPSIFLTVITTIFAVSAITQSKLWGFVYDTCHKLFELSSCQKVNSQTTTRRITFS